MNEFNDDWALVNRASVDRQAAGLLFDRYKDYVYRLAYGLHSDQSLAEDTVQSVFLKLQEKKFKLKAQAKFTTWLYQFVLNTAREIARKKKRLVPVSELQIEKLKSETTQNDKTEDVINFRDLQKALTQLPERQREIFILRYLEGFSTRETAEIVGCKEGTAKTHLARATAKIELILNVDTDTGSDTTAPSNINYLNLTGESDV